MRASDPHHIGSLKWQDPSPLGPGAAVSAFVHAGLIALGLVLWQNPPTFSPEDVIPVALVADTPSVIGPETEAETVRTGEENSEMAVADAPVADAAPSPETTPNVAPAAPTPQPVQKAPPPKPAPASAQKAVSPPPAPTKASPQKRSATQPAPNLPTKAETKTPAQQPRDLQFDFAAASAAASKADSGGRSTPKLAASGQSAKQGRAGGGTLLAGDLEAALRAQIYQCWRRPADTSARLIVSLQIELGPDGNLVRDPKLIRPTSRAGADGKLLVAIDDAMRAVRQCSPFSLPADRHTQWRLVNFDFDARKADRP